MSYPLKYSISIGDVCEDWGTGLSEAAREEFLLAFRTEIVSELGRVNVPWSLDLETLTLFLAIPSLHAIPDSVHRDLLRRWLVEVNRMREPERALHPGPSVMSGGSGVKVLCCSWGGEGWKRCSLSALNMGLDETTATQWMVEITRSRRTERIPVYAQAWWDTALTDNGYPEYDTARVARPEVRIGRGSRAMTGRRR
jgi:hypothetical protein